MPDLNTVTFDASQWQPIETAPKDGTEVTLLFASEVTVIDKVRPRVRAAAWLGDWTIPYRRDNPPTHWMPLPAAPSATPTPAAQSAGQEPVAWRYLTPTGWHAQTDLSKITRIREHHQVEPLYAAPVNGGERRDEVGLSERDYAEIERAADAQQVGGRVIPWDLACVVLNKWLEKNYSSLGAECESAFDAECQLFRELAALTSPAKVGSNSTQSGGKVLAR